MDPNEALTAIRERVARLGVLCDSEQLQQLLASLDVTQPSAEMSELVGEASELVEYVEGLDQWLSRGGFLPAAWNRTVPS